MTFDEYLLKWVTTGKIGIWGIYTLLVPKQAVLEPKRANGNSIEKGKKVPKWVDTIFPYFDKVDETI